MIARAMDVKKQDAFYLQLSIGLIVLVTLGRLGLLTLNPFNIGPDEAQYWDWSRTLDFGYFSKPPLIAWLIGIERALCGDGEPCIRMLSSLFHGGTSFVLFLLGRSLFDARIGFYGALVFLTLPAVSFSSGIISTDVPLLFFWALSLLSFHHVLKSKSYLWALLLGIALGFAFLAKYAAIYFILCGFLFLFLSREKEWRALLGPLSVSACIALLLLSPNLIWNMQNGFATVSHTAANANWAVELFNLESLGDFIGDQFGIFGLVFFPAFIALAFLRLKSFNTFSKSPAFFLLCFSVPILLVVTAQSFISRANANWAATSMVAASLFLAAMLLSKEKNKKSRVLFGAGLTTNIVLGLFIYSFAIWPSLIEPLGMAGAFKRVRGWDQIGSHVEEVAERRGTEVVLADDRLVLTELLYYMRTSQRAFRIWDYDNIPQNHYEQTMALTDAMAGPFLLVAREQVPKPIFEEFRKIRFLKTLRVPIGGKFTRTLYLYELDGFDGL